ncbi:hypothetical protein GCM10020254_36280 [Streptomyces goshikiensis]
MHVAAAGLVHVVAAGGGHVRDGGRHRDLDAEHVARGVRGAAAEADEDTGRAGAHQVQGRGVGGAAADDDRDVELVDELLQVQRLGGAGDVLRRHRGAADDEDVHARVDDGLGELGGALRGERGGGDDARVAHLLDALPDQVGLDRRGVDLLEAAGGRLLVQLRDLVEQRLRVLVPGPQAFEVQHAEAAELADADGGLRGDDRVHGGCEEGQLEAVGVDLPGDRDLLRVPRTPARDDGDVVERVRPAAALAAPDLDLSHVWWPFLWVCLSSIPEGRGPAFR